MNDKILVLVYPVGGDPYEKYIDADDTLKGLQGIVGGLIQPVDVEEYLSVYVNEEGLLIGLEPNRIVGRLGALMGDMVLSRINEEGETVSITEKDIATWKHAFPRVQ